MLQIKIAEAIEATNEKSPDSTTSASAIRRFSKSSAKSSGGKSKPNAPRFRWRRRNVQNRSRN